MNNETVEKIWSEYLKSIGEDEKNTEKEYTAWSFGNTEDMANELVELVLKGEKRATTSLYCLYNIDGEDLPSVGELSIITDSNNIAKCIIENKKVSIIPFCDINEKFSFKESEGDKSLEYWRSVHIDFFKNALKKINKDFAEDMTVVCEEFEVIYKN